jgi:hypothetical protein
MNIDNDCENYLRNQESRNTGLNPIAITFRIYFKPGCPDEIRNAKPKMID